jgi:hypothetical protein
MPDKQSHYLGNFPTVVEARMWESWIQFVYHTREDMGITWSCKQALSRSRIAYPHWPPTTHREAFDQLCLMQDPHNRHRRYLSHQWWTYVLELAGAAGEPQNVCGDYMEIADGIRGICPSINMELEKVEVIRNKPSELRCHNLCDKVIKQRGSSICLCFCHQHREDCPVHGQM